MNILSADLISSCFQKTAVAGSRVPTTSSRMMKALRFHGQNDIRLEDVEIPKCGMDQVKVGSYHAFRFSHQLDSR